MGYVWKLIFMIFIIMSMLPLSSQNTDILIDDSLLNAVEDFNNGIDIKNELKKVSGEDENEGKEVFILEKVRVLLGLKSLENRISSDFSPSPSPSSLPADTPSPVAAPAIHIHEHSHPHRLHLHKSRAAYKPRRKDVREHRVRRILIAVLVSVGATILICALAAFWFCKKFKSQKEKPTKTISVKCKTEGKAARSKYVTSQNQESKRSSKSGLDLFDLNLLGMGVEEQSSGVKKTSSSVKEFSIHKERELNREMSDSDNDNDNDNVSVSSTKKEVDRKSIQCESSGADSFSRKRVIIPVKSYSSDDESFHSCGDSNLSNVRLSNASESSANVRTNSTHSIPTGNLSNHLETECDEPNTSLASQMQLTLSSSNSEPKMPMFSKSAGFQKNVSSIPPPPPPPPPPRPTANVFRSTFSLSSPFSTREETGSTSSSAWLKSSSPAMSDFSPGLSPWNDLPSPQNAAKPSQTPSVIPAPPCPPPSLKANSYSFKTPPPPPSKMPQFMAFGKDGNSRPKLKPLHWDKVRAAPDQSMVWDKLRWSSFELNEEMIESLFGYNQQDSMKNGDTSNKSPSPSKHILEPKRLQNLTILLKSLNVSTEQVCEAIEQGNGLRLRQLEALMQMVPTPEEEAKLLNYEGDISELGSTEKFVMAILRIPYSFQRVEAMLYKETFEDEVNHLRNSFSMLEEACKELKSSRLFLKLLEAVLKTGNRMNVGTSRGGARAFKLDALLKLSDVKGTDGKTSLLHFVVQEMIRSEGIRVSGSIMGKISQKNKARTNEERENDYKRMGLDLVSGLSTELYNVKRSSTIDLNVLESSTKNLTEGIIKLQRLVCNDLSKNEKSENFIMSLTSFLSYVKKTMEELKKDEEKVLSCVKEITEYFHGNVSKEETNPVRIFVIVRDFLGMLDNVCKSFKIGS